MALFGFGGKKKPNKEDAKKALEEKRKSIAKKKAGGARSSSKKPSGKKPAAKAPTAKRPSVRKVPSKTKRPSAATKPAAEGRTSMPSTTGDERKIRKSSNKKQIGQLLLKADKINQEQLDKALKIQLRKGGLLGQILSRMELITKADVGAALRKQRTITTVPLDAVEFDPDALCLLTREFCEKHKLVPFEKLGNQICIAMSNALDTTAKSDIKDVTQMQVKIFDAGYDDIMSSITKHLTDMASGNAPRGAQQADDSEIETTPDDVIIELPDEEIITIDDEEIITLDEEEDTSEDAGPLIEGIHAVDTSNFLSPSSDSEPEPAKSEFGKEDALSLMSGVQPLKAIPVPDAYFAEAVAGEVTSAEKRWLAEHASAIALPAVAWAG